MKGKKVDNDYVASFIQDCIKDGIVSAAGISVYAHNCLTIIDAQIKQAEALKKERSKILDVLTVLGKVGKDKSKDKELLKQYEKIHEQK